MSELAWPMWIFLGLVTYGFYQGRVLLFQCPLAHAVETIYGANPILEPEQVAAFIRTNFPPKAKIAVLGSEPQIYFRSGRRSATGYLYTYGLTENQPFALKMQQEMLAEVESAKAECVVLITAGISWVEQSESNRSLIEEHVRALLANYDLKRSFDSSSARAAQPGDLSPILVYQRRSP